jgi:hypothetical protein
VESTKQVGREDGVHVTLTYDTENPPASLMAVGAALNDATDAIAAMREALFTYPLEVDALTSATNRLCEATCRRTSMAVGDLLHGPRRDEDDNYPPF